MIYIYGLVCPVAGDVRYIGKSINPEKRLRAHIGAAVRGEYQHHAARWLRRLASRGQSPAIRILEEVPDGGDWRVSERAWIARAASEGWRITNSTAGGEGLDYLDPRDEAEYKKNHRAAMKKLAATEAGKAGIRKMLDAQTPESRRKASTSLKKHYSQPEAVERLRAAITEAQQRPETRARHSAASKAAWASDHEGMKAKIWTDETRRKHRQKRVASWADPEVRKRMENRWTPEARAKQAEELASRREKMLQARTPEARAKQAESLRATWAKRKAIKK